MEQDLNSLRAALAEREASISKMRVEISQYSSRVTNYKVVSKFTRVDLRERENS